MYKQKYLLLLFLFVTCKNIVKKNWRVTKLQKIRLIITHIKNYKG